MNPVVHFELLYDQAARITQFYQTVFGWKTQVLGEDMGNYVLATTAESDARPGSPAGAIDGGFYPRKTDWPAQYPSIPGWIQITALHRANDRKSEEGKKVYELLARTSKVVFKQWHRRQPGKALCRTNYGTHIIETK